MNEQIPALLDEVQQMLELVLETLRNPPPREVTITNIKRDTKGAIIGGSITTKKDNNDGF